MKVSLRCLASISTAGLERHCWLRGHSGCSCSRVMWPCSTWHGLSLGTQCMLGISAHSDEPSGCFWCHYKTMPLYENGFRLFFSHVQYGCNKDMIWIALRLSCYTDNTLWRSCSRFSLMVCHVYWHFSPGVNFLFLSRSTVSTEICYFDV